VKMDLEGQVTESDDLCGAASCSGTGFVTDLDGDDDFEFVLETQSGNADLTIRSDVTYSSLWSSGQGSLVPVDADLNGDGYKDLISFGNSGWYGSPYFTLLYGPDYQTVDVFNDRHGPVAAGDLDGDGVLEILIGQNLYRRVNGRYELSTLTPGACELEKIANIDAVAGDELVCVKSVDYPNPGAGFTRDIVIYNAAMQEIRRINVPFTVTDMDFIDSGNSDKDILVATRGFDYYYSDKFSIALVSASQGAIVWNSPYLLGDMTLVSLHTFKDRAERLHISLATSNAMYITR